MEIQFKTAKKMLLTEYEGHYKNAQQVMINAYVPDVQKEMVHNGYYAAREKIEASTDWEMLEEAISFCGYRMSLQEWLDSY